MKIDGSVFVVTGGASGLGEATVRHLVSRGARCVIADMNAERGEAVAAELADAAVFCRTNVVADDDCAAAVATAVDTFGGLHGLVNCAGIGLPAKVLGRDGPMDMKAFTRVIEVNLIGTFNMIRLATEAMQGNQPNDDGERGVVINTASVAAFDGQIGQASYSASKGGVVGMTLPIAREMARHGIRVMTIAPGLFETPMMAELPEEARASLGQQVPFPPRLGRPAEYASMAGHIIDNPMLNGETIRLDGAIRMAPK